MAPAVLQTAGFFLGVIGSAALIAATAMTKWSVADMQSDPITSTYTYKGLWRDCETSAAGMTECRPYYGLMGYSGSFQAVRALMIVGVVLSVLGAVISVFSLKCLTMNSGSQTSKAKMSLAAGIMFIIGGICGIAAASLYANQIVASFRMATNQNYGGGGYGGGGYGGGGFGGQGMGGMGSLVPRYTFGAALFVAWIGGGILLVGGVLKSLAFKGMVEDDKTRYPGVAYVKSHSKPDHDVHLPDDTRTRPDQKYV